MTRIALVALAAIGLASSANAQSSVPLTEMNFDMWCQETQHLPPTRCDKRLPDDDAAFQAYQTKIQSYEVPYLQQREQKDNMNRVILHNDPVDHPTVPSKPKDSPPPDVPPN